MGLLEDHGNVPPAYTPHRLFIQRQQVLLPKADLTANNAPGWSGHQPHNAQGADGLPTPRLAHQRHGFAGTHVIAHPIDGADGPRGSEEIGFEVADREQHIPHPLYGCAASQLRKTFGEKTSLHLRPGGCLLRTDDAGSMVEGAGKSSSIALGCCQARQALTSKLVDSQPRQPCGRCRRLDDLCCVIFMETQAIGWPH